MLLISYVSHKYFDGSHTDRTTQFSLSKKRIYENRLHMYLGLETFGWFSVSYKLCYEKLIDLLLKNVPVDNGIHIFYSEVKFGFCFTHRQDQTKLKLGNNPGTHCIGGWVGPGAGLDVMEKRRISCFYQESKPNSSAIQPIL